MSGHHLRRNLALTIVGLLAVIVVPITATTSALAAAVPTLWTQVQDMPVAAGTAAGSSRAVDLSCPAVGACTALGTANLPDGSQDVTVTSSSGGEWATGQVLAFAPGTVGVPPYAEGRSIACASPGNCAAVGWFFDARGSRQAFVATQSGGVWGRATPVRFAAGAQSTPNVAIATSVACPAPGACTAVGGYQDPTGSTRTFTVSSSGGTWGTARPVIFPAASEAASRHEEPADVACVSTTRCTITGSYVDAADHRQAFWSQLSGSTWSTAQTVTFAPGTTAPNPSASFNGLFSLGAGRHLDCSATGRCSAVGFFAAAGGGAQIFAVPLDGAGAGQAVSLSASLRAPVQNLRLSSAISCTGVDECTMVGFQLGFGSTGVALRVIGATSTAGVWSPATELPLDHEVTVSGPDQINAGLDVSCAAVGECSVVGVFANANRGLESLVITRSEGQWLPGRRVAGPGPAGSAAQAAYLSGVECAEVASCTAIGVDDLTTPQRSVSANAWPMPAAPTAVSAAVVPGTHTVTVGWTPPVAPPVPDMYQVRCETPAGTDAVFAGPLASPATLSVRAGASYHCGVRARYGTAFGGTFQGDWFEGPLAWSGTVSVPATAPDAPVGVTATGPAQPSGRSTSVSFTLPTNLSGAPISQYEANCESGNGGTTRSATGNASPVQVGNLTTGRTYACRARSRNSVGWSTWSAGATVVVPAGPPTAVHATTPGAGSSATTVTFTAPDGGPTPTNYRTTCTSSNGGQAKGVLGTGSPVTVTGLTRTKTYRCTVGALFDGTPGPVSAASNSITVPAH